MKKVIIISFILIFSSMLVVNFGLAAATGGASEDQTSPDQPSDPISLTNPLSATPTPQQLIGKIIQAVLGLVGSLALLMFVYGGLTWMTAAGNGDKVQKGKDILMWSAIGLVVIFASYAAISFIFTSLGV